MAEVLLQISNKPVTNTTIFPQFTTMNINNQVRLSDPVHYAISNSDTGSNDKNNSSMSNSNQNNITLLNSGNHSFNGNNKQSLPPLSSVLSQISNLPNPSPSIKIPSYQTVSSTTFNKPSDQITIVPKFNSGSPISSISSVSSNNSFPPPSITSQDYLQQEHHVYYQQQQKQQNYQQHTYSQEKVNNYYSNHNVYIPSPNRSRTPSSTSSLPSITDPNTLTGTPISDQNSIVSKSQNHFPDALSYLPKTSTSLEIVPPIKVERRSESPSLHEEPTSHSSGISNSSKIIKKLRKYACKVCEKSFTTSGHLARHSKIHTGERNHTCPYDGCTARFSRQDNCMQHFKTHLNVNKKRKRSKI